jgi:hypothetical protein
MHTHIHIYTHVHKHQQKQIQIQIQIQTPHPANPAAASVPTVHRPSLTQIHTHNTTQHIPPSLSLPGAKTPPSTTRPRRARTAHAKPQRHPRTWRLATAVSAICFLCVDAAGDAAGDAPQPLLLSLSLSLSLSLNLSACFYRLRGRIGSDRAASLSFQGKRLLMRFAW